MTHTKKLFREFLNARYPFDAGKNNAHGANPGPRVRAYGNYLYAQDRDMFDMEYERWKRGEKFL